MSAVLLRRTLLATTLAAPALLTFPRGLLAAPGTTTWDSGNKSPLIQLSNSDLTAAVPMSGMAVAMDLGTSTFWVFNPRTGYWNNNASASPSSGTGGYTPSPTLTSGTYYAACWLQDSSNNQMTFNFGTATLTSLPTGYSTYNTATGATVTLDTSFNTSGKMAYSNGDLTVTQVGTDSSGALMSRATHGVSSGKVYFEVIINSQVGGLPGIAHSTLANTDYMWNGSQKGWGAYTVYAYNNALTASDAIGSNVLTSASSCRGSLLRTSGKLMFEATFNYTTTRDIALGVCNTSYTTFTNTSPGQANSWGYDHNGSGTHVGYNGGATTSADALTNGAKLGIYIDFGNQRLWYYVPGASSRYNTSPTANPATNTGGIDISAIISGGLYPLCGGGDSTGLTTGPANLVANFGATAFTSPVPSGFLPWNAGPPTSGGPRGIIIP